MQRKLTSLEEMNQTYEQMINEFKERFILIRRRIEDIFENRFPDHRVIVEQRLNFLESQFMDFTSQVNPYHVQPGLVLEITLTSIKRLRITIKGMANVLNEFLMSVSKGFTDVTVSEHARRRSTVRTDADQFIQAHAE